ncbi:MAG: hypothetical protein IMZ62_11825, partial [Chloroflexi bacterium]|nr:hypothetical protein [Chloroflexota bacterium]
MDARHVTAMAMCQLLLRQKQAERGSPLNREDIGAAVEQVVGMLGYADIDGETLTKALEERFTVYAPDHRTLGSDDDHVAWLPARRGAVAWRYWDRYRIFLD